MEDEVRVAHRRRRRSGDRARRGTRHGRTARLPPTGSHPHRHRHLGGRAQHRRARRPWRDRPEAARGARPLRPGRDRHATRGRASATSRRRCATTTAAGAASASACPARAASWTSFELESGADTGTTVTMKKWRFRDELARLREERRRRALSGRHGSRSSGASPTRCRRGEATNGDLAVVALAARWRARRGD